MADKIKKISVTAFEKAVNDGYSNITEFEWKGLTVAVKKTLSLAEMVAFVNKCTEICIDPESGEVAEEVFDFAIDLCTVVFYSNISLPSDIEKRYDLIIRSGIAQVIRMNVNAAQYDSMDNAIRTKLYDISRSGIEAFRREVDSVADMFNKYREEMKNVTQSIDEGNLRDVLSVFKSGDISEEKLANAILGMKDREDEQS